jgi:hypothetical protein
MDITGITSSDIKNQALFMLGFVDEIDFTSLTDATVKKVNRIYDTTLITVLSSYRWLFAIKRLELGSLMTGAFTVVSDTDILTSTINFQDGHAVTVSSTTTLPSPLVAGTTYYVVSASGLTCKLSATQGGTAIDITDTGTGTHTISYASRIEAGDDYKYKYNYQLPSDLLTYNASYTDVYYDCPIKYFEVIVPYLNTDETKAYLMYTSLVDETVFPQYFISYFRYKLALELCFNLTGDTNLIQMLSEQEHRGFIRAKNIDARQASTKTVKSSPFTAIRG